MNFLLGLEGERLENIIDNRLKGVGMIRSEYLCRSIEEYFTLNSCREYVYNYVSNVCDIFHDYEVWYRTSELTVPEVNVLKGADQIIEEKHYILGLRRVRRGIKFSDTFLLELDNISKLSEEKKNLNILFPYVKDSNELKKCIELLKKVNFKNKFGVMIEIPSAITEIDEFIKLGISNITIGVNDLTTLMLGSYRESEVHDITHPSIVKVRDYIVKKCKDNNVSVNVAGNVNKKLKEICANVGVENFIVNYPLLSDVLNIPLEKLPEINRLKDIKKLTKSRIIEFNKRKKQQNYNYWT